MWLRAPIGVAGLRSRQIEPSRRAALLATVTELQVALVGATEPAGLLGAWIGAGALAAGGLIDMPWGGLGWWALLPVALLAALTLRWLVIGRGARDLSEIVRPDDLVAAGVEASWWSLAQLAAEGGTDEAAMTELAVAWQLSVCDSQDSEEELGARPGTAMTTARRLAAEHGAGQWPPTAPTSWST